MPIPRFIRSAMLKYVLFTQHHYDKGMALAAQLANDEFTKTKDFMADIATGIAK